MGQLSVYSQTGVINLQEVVAEINFDKQSRQWETFVGDVFEPSVAKSMVKGKLTSEKLCDVSISEFLEKSKRDYGTNIFKIKRVGYQIEKPVIQKISGNHIIKKGRHKINAYSIKVGNHYLNTKVYLGRTEANRVAKQTFINLREKTRVTILQQYSDGSESPVAYVYGEPDGTRKTMTKPLKSKAAFEIWEYVVAAEIFDD